MSRIEELIAKRNQASGGTATVGPQESAAGASAAMLSGIAAEPVAGWAGIVGSLLPGEEGQGAEWVEATREALTYTPRDEMSQQSLQSIGESIQPLGEKIEQAENYLGDVGYDIGGPMGGAIGKSIPTAAGEALGVLGLMKAPKIAERAGDVALSSSMKAANAVSDAADMAGDARRAIPQSATKQKIAKMIEEGSTDKLVAKYKLEPPKNGKGVLSATDKGHSIMKQGAKRVVNDPVAINAIKQGADAGVVSGIKGASKSDHKAMIKMLKKMETLKNNPVKARTNRPGDVVGDSLNARVKKVWQENRKAGSRLDAEAKKLKGKPGVGAGRAHPANLYVKDMEDIGVTFDEKFNPNFVGSDIEGIGSSEKALAAVMSRLKRQNLDAYELHRLKRYIDENITYGKAGEGLKGKGEQVLRSLRKNIDDSLDELYPSYDEVNTQYSDTIGALDALQDSMGKKFDFTGDSANQRMGQTLRRLMSNTPSRVALMDSIDEVEAVARKYGGQYDDSLFTQALFADELDKVFKPAARTGFESLSARQVQEAGQMGVSAAMTGGKSVPFDAARSALGKIAGRTDEKAFDALRELLRESIKNGN